MLGNILYTTKSPEFTADNGFSHKPLQLAKNKQLQSRFSKRPKNQTHKSAKHFVVIL